MSRKKVVDPRLTAYPYARTGEMSTTGGVSTDYLRYLKNNVLQEKIYWFYPPGSSRLLWNAQLVKDWLVQGDSAAHQKAVETYLKSRLSSQ
jgi:hypothetical protein